MIKTWISASFLLAMGVGVADAQTVWKGLSEEVWHNVQFCFWEESNQSVIQKASKIPPQGDCAEVAVGAAIAGLPAEFLMVSERQLAVATQPLACSPSPSDQALIVALIAACQCHNTPVQELVIRKGGQVVEGVRLWHYGMANDAQRAALEDCDRAPILLPQ